MKLNYRNTMLGLASVALLTAGGCTGSNRIDSANGRATVTINFSGAPGTGSNVRFSSRLTNGQEPATGSGGTPWSIGDEARVQIRQIFVQQVDPAAQNSLLGQPIGLLLEPDDIPVGSFRTRPTLRVNAPLTAGRYRITELRVETISFKDCAPGDPDTASVPNTCIGNVSPSRQLLDTAIITPTQATPRDFVFSYQFGSGYTITFGSQAGTDVNQDVFLNVASDGTGQVTIIFDYDSFLAALEAASPIPAQAMACATAYNMGTTKYCGLTTTLTCTMDTDCPTGETCVPSNNECPTVTFVTPSAATLKSMAANYLTVQ